MCSTTKKFRNATKYLVMNAFLNSFLSRLVYVNKGCEKILKIFYSELCLVNEDIFEGIEKLIAHGAENIELMLDGRSWDGYEEQMDVIAEKLKAYNVSYAVHSPVWNFNLTASSGYIRKAAMKAYKDSIIFAQKIAASHVVLHPGFADIPYEDKDYMKALAKEAMKELAQFNESYGVDLLMENVGSEKSSIFTMEEYISFLDDLPPSIQFIVDVGHANITRWDLSSLIRSLGARLKAFHINDNDAEQDIHLAMFEGTVDWQDFFRILRGEGRAYDLILEYNVNTDLSKLSEGKKILMKEFSGKIQEAKW